MIENQHERTGHFIDKCFISSNLLIESFLEKIIENKRFSFIFDF
jgi:hypothetical protein